MRFQLRKLLIVLAVLPPLLAGAWFAVSATIAHERARRASEELTTEILTMEAPAVETTYY